MALRFMDGFDHYAIADVTRKWTSGVVQTGSMTSSTRFGVGQAWTNNNGRIGLSKVIDSQATWIVGFAWKMDVITTNTPLWVFIDGSTSHITVDCTTAPFKLQVKRGTTSGTVIGTGTTVVSQAVWHYIEIKVTINDSTGVAVVKMDGKTEINLSNVDTRNGGNSTADTHQISGNPADTNPTFYDDVYILDSTGSRNNDFIGEMRVSTIYPTGAGAHTDWTPSTGSNWQNVDDAQHNSDTDYNSSSTPNQIDTYAMGNLPATANNVYGVWGHYVARKDDAGTRQLASVTRISSTDYVGATKNMASTYDFFDDLYETSPATSTAWTVSEVNGMEFGVKEIS